MPDITLIGESCAIATVPMVDIHGRRSRIASPLGAITLGERAAARTLGYELRTLDADLSIEKQQADIAELIEAGVAAITTWSLDREPLEPLYRRAREAGIPIVGFNSESEHISTVIRQEPDFSDLPGERAAAYIADRIPGARVIVIGGPPLPALLHRERSFVAAAEARGLEIVARGDNSGDFSETAMPVVREMLDRHPGAQAIWCFNDLSALGAANILFERGIPAWSGDREGVIVSGVNGMQEAVDAIEAGLMTFTHDGMLTDAGVAAIRALEPVLTGTGTADDMPAELVTPPSRLIDISNADAYVPWPDRVKE